TTDLVGLISAFVATLVLGIEIGILIAVVASMLVVFARMSKPHTAILGHVPGTTTYRNVARFDEAKTIAGIRIVRIDAAVSFVNADYFKKLMIRQAAEAAREEPKALILDASGINDIDATGAEIMSEVVEEVEGLGVNLYLSGVKGPVRDVLRRCRLWDVLVERIHASTFDAVDAATSGYAAPIDSAAFGIDERPRQGRPAGPTSSVGSPTTTHGLHDLESAIGQSRTL
ncbi:MAG: sodium-independent anion transporter, partial [Acidimicrobiia bacterium]|nr:sodium-independent anion transporter [Acidimicrobiia bacterium]